MVAIAFPTHQGEKVDVAATDRRHKHRKRAIGVASAEKLTPQSYRMKNYSEAMHARHSAIRMKVAVLHRILHAKSATNAPYGTLEAESGEEADITEFPIELL